TAGLLDPRGGLLGIGLLAREVRDRHVRALPGEGDGGGAADPGISAGDEGLQAVESPGAAVRVLAVVGHGRHVTRQAGRLLFLRGEPARVVDQTPGVFCDVAACVHGPERRRCATPHPPVRSSPLAMCVTWTSLLPA